jgi:hypothetical protein
MIRTELRTVLATAFGDRSDRPCSPSQVTVSPTILTWRRGLQLHLFLEQVEGYVKALEKSTCPLSTITEVFEHCARKD